MKVVILTDEQKQNLAEMKAKIAELRKQQKALCEFLSAATKDHGNSRNPLRTMGNTPISQIAEIMRWFTPMAKTNKGSPQMIEMAE